MILVKLSVDSSHNRDNKKEREMNKRNVCCGYPEKQEW
jgi:hypothetical protein